MVARQSDAQTFPNITKERNTVSRKSWVRTAFALMAFSLPWIAGCSGDNAANRTDAGGGAGAGGTAGTTGTTTGGTAGAGGGAGASGK